jgi:hypothetical protein
MAVTKVSPLPFEGSWNRLWQREYTRKFRVFTSDRYDGPAVIRATTNGMGQPALPIIGNSYFVNSSEKDLGSFASQITYQQEIGEANGNTGQWLVTVQYTPYDAAMFGTDPTAWPIKIRFTGQKYEKVLYADQAGNPIVNSAGDPFSDPVTVDDSRSLITIQRNELVSSFDFTLSETYRDTVNNAVWNGFDTKTVKCATIDTSDPTYDSNNQVYYLEVVYLFEINRDTWVKKILDQGFSELDGSGNPKAITNAGQPVSDPVPLDGSGHRLGSGGTPVYLSFDAYPDKDFSTFNLDFSRCLGRI